MARTATPSGDLLKVRTDHGGNGCYLINRTIEPKHVRRFREQLDRETQKYTPVELLLERVSAEREAAEKHL